MKYYLKSLTNHWMDTKLISIYSAPTTDEETGDYNI